MCFCQYAQRGTCFKCLDLISETGEKEWRLEVEKGRLRIQSPVDGWENKDCAVRGQDLNVTAKDFPLKSENPRRVGELSEKQGNM